MQKTLQKTAAMRHLARRLALAALVLLAPAVSWGQSTLTVCRGTATDGKIPVNGLYVDTHGTTSEFIIPADSLTDMVGASITKVTFYISSIPDTWGSPTIQLYIGEIQSTTSGAIIGASSYTVVNTSVWSNQSNTIEVEFDAPYTYTGENLLIGTYVQTASGTYKTTNFLGADNFESGVSRYNNGSGDGSAKSFLPQTTFEYQPAAGACPKPSQLQASNITGHTAVLSWTGTASAYEWQYKKTSASSWQNGGTVTASTYTMTGLDPQSEYLFSVRSNCDPNYSDYREITFTTDVACPAPANFTADNITATSATLSWTGGSSSYTLQSANVGEVSTVTVLSEGFESGSMPDGWSQTGSYWQITSGTGHSSNTYSGSATGSYNAGCYIGSYSGSDILVTPVMDLGSAISATLNFNFWNTAWGGDINTLNVYYRVNGGDWQLLYTNNQEVGSWTPVSIELTGMAANYQIGFECESNYSYGMAIDDVEIVAQSANISWTDVNTNATSPYSYSGLTPMTTYRLRLIGNCGSEGTSAPSDVLTFTTTVSCPAPANLSVTTDGATATATWEGTASSYNININGTVYNNITSPYTFNVALSTSYSVMAQSNCGGETSSWTDAYNFTTPACLGGHTIEYTLTDSYGDGWNGNAIHIMDACESVETLANQDLDGTNGTETQTGTLTLCGDYYQFTWEVGSYSGEATFTLIDNGVTLFSNQVGSGLSDGQVLYTIGTAPTMLPLPTDLAATPAARQVELSWTENGTATAWQLCINDNETNLIDVNSNPVTLTGLNTATSYTVKVRATDATNTSCWTENLTFSTTDPCPAPANLLVEADGHNATLTWDGSADSYEVRYAATDASSLETLHYDNAPYYGSTGAMGGGNSNYYWGVMFPAGSYTGSYLSSVSVFNSEAANATLYIYNDGTSAPSNLITSKAITMADVDTYVDYAFDQPVAIDPTKNLWVVLFTTAGTPAASTNASTNANGQWYSTDGNSWYTWLYDWMIRANMVNFGSSTTVTSNNSITITGLAAATDHMAQVRSICTGAAVTAASPAGATNLAQLHAKDGNVIYSNWSTVTFTTDIANPAPSTVEVNNILTTTAEVSWTADANATGATLQYATTVGAEYKYDNGTFNTSVGTNGGVFSWGIMLPAGSYTGNTLSNVSVYDVAEMTGTLTIYNDGQSVPANAVATVPVTLTGADDFVDFNVNATIDATKNVWIIFTNESAANYPAACSADELDDANGRWVELNGTWNDIANLGVSGNCFMIHAEILNVDFSSLSWTTVSDVTSPYQLTGLTPGTLYAVRVNSLFADEPASAWTMTSFTTLPANLVPFNLQSSDITASAASLDWEGVQDNYNMRWWHPTIVNFNAFSQAESDYTAQDVLTTYTVDLSAFSGTGDVAIRHYNVTDMFRLNIDDIVLTNASGQEIVNENFESGEFPADWVNYDLDGDGQGYYMYPISGQDGNGNDLCNGSYCLTSASYNGSALTPDNWLIIPNVELGGTLTFVARGHDPSWAGEVFGVFVSTTPCVTPATTPVLVENITAPYAFTGLTPNSDYVWQVQGNMTDGTTEWSESATFTTLPLCSVPTDLAVTDGSLTAHGATLTWTSDASAWEIQLGDESPIEVTSASYTFSGLNPETEYSVRVRANCGGLYSDWSSPVSFTTACAAITSFPWTEDFESYATGDFSNPCWVNEHIEGSDTYIFKISTYSLGGNTTHQLQLPDMHSGTQTKLMLPVMELPANYEFSIDVYRNTYGSTYAEEGIRVFASTNGEIEGATELAFIPRQYDVSNGSIPAESAAGWYTYELPLGMSGTCYIILRGESQYGTATYMDNFAVKAIPTCPKPTALAVTANSVTAHTAAVTWTENGEATTWILETATDADFTSVTSETVETTPAFSFEGLDPETTYYVRVKASCGPGDESEYSTVVSFTTTVACPAPTGLAAEPGNYAATLNWNGTSESYIVSYRTAAYNEGIVEHFDVSGVPAGWTRYSGLVDDAVAGTAPQATAGGWYTTTYAMGQYNMKVNIYGPSAKYWLVTPEFNLSQDLSFDLALTAYNSADPISTTTTQADDRFVVLIYANNAWTILREWNNSGSADVFNNISYTGEPVTIDLSAYYGQNVKIAFYGESTVSSNGDNDLHIDNVICGTPYEAGEWQTVTSNETTATITGLTPETAYDAKVQGNCGALDGMSVETNILSFTTLEACPVPQNVAVDNITSTSATVAWSDYNESYNVSYRTAAYNEGIVEHFDVSGVPAGWTRYSGLVDDVIAGTAPQATTSGWYTTTYAMGQYNMKVNIYGPSAKYWLVSPEFNLSQDLSFDLALTQYNSDAAIDDVTKQADDRFVVLIYANDAWTILREWNNSGSADVYNNIPNTAENVTIDLSAYYGQNVKIAFYGESTNPSEMENTDGDNDLHIDNIVCGTAYEAGEWQTVSVDDATATLTGLIPARDYEVKVQGLCGTDETEWSAITTFTTEEAFISKEILANKWYAISSPVHDNGQDFESVGNVGNLVPIAGEFAYDLYSYNEQQTTWVNHKVANFDLQKGAGYIYRRSEDAILDFTGEVNTEDVTVNLTSTASAGDLQGFNLIGNPFNATYPINQTCYNLTTNGVWHTNYGSYTIGIAEAVLVQTNVADEYTFEPSAKKVSHSAPALAFTLAGNGFEDVAYASFNDGKSLPKIAHLNSDAPMLSIPVDGRRYAVATLAADCQSFPLVLRASAGEYTLTANNTEVGYLHLIDRLTGSDVDLLANATYTFRASDNDADRFTVKLSPDAIDNAGSNFVYWNGSNWMVEGNGTLGIYDVMGRLIFSNEVIDQLSISNSQFPATGVYILRMGEKSQKIVVK